MFRLLTVVIGLSIYLSADFLKAEVGAGIWQVSSTGEIRTNYEKGSIQGKSVIDIEEDLGLDSTIGTYAWANFKHFVPLIPNARLEFTKLGADATKDIPDFNSTYFNGQELKDANVASKLNLDQIDAILYYNLLDDTLFITFDIGFGVKYYTGSLELDNNTLDVDFPVPLVYGRLGARLPGTNITTEADIKYFKYTPSVDAEMIDLRMKVNATILSIALLDLNIEAGYRVHRLQVLASDNKFVDFGADIKSEVSGFFGGINLSF